MSEPEEDDDRDDRQRAEDEAEVLGQKLSGLVLVALCIAYGLFLAVSYVMGRL